MNDGKYNPKKKSNYNLKLYLTIYMSVINISLDNLHWIRYINLYVKVTI